MSRQAHIALPLLMLVLLMGVASCNDDSCYENGSSLPLAEFYMNGAKSTITGITVMGIGVPGDSLLADSGSLNEIYLPLRASTSSTSYFIGRWATFEGERLEFVDTITIEYRPIEYFQSAECGAMFNFDVKHLSWTENAIDSVTLVTPMITNSITPAMRIHFTDFDL